MNNLQPDEFAPYQSTYINLVPEGNLVEILAMQKDQVYDYFCNIPLEKAEYAYAEGKWTVKEVLGHIIDTERIFAYRALRISRNDQTPISGFEQDLYVQNAPFNGRSLENLANEFKAVRESNLYFFRNLTGEQWLIKGVASDHPLSVRTCAYIIAGHVLHHQNVLGERYFGEGNGE